MLSNKQVLQQLNTELGLGVTEESIEDFLEFHERPSDQLLTTNFKEGDALNGTVGKVLFSAAIAGFSGGAGFSWTLAVIAGLGTYLSSRNQTPKDTPNEEEYANETGFGSVGQTAVTPGLVLPVVHGNRFVNPNGGARIQGQLIFNNIDTFLGQQKRKSLFIASIGTIGSVDVDQTLIGEQAKELYFDNEIDARFRPGTQLQSTIDEFGFYSQAVKPQGFNEIELDFEGRFSSVTLVEDEAADLTNIDNTTPGVICNTAVDPGFGESGLFGTNPIDPGVGGSMSFTSGALTDEYSIGLSAIDSDLAQNTTQWSFYFDGAGTTFILENGTEIDSFPTTPGVGHSILMTAEVPAVPPTLIPPDPGSPFIPAFIEYYIGGNLVAISPLSPTGPIFIDVAMATPGACLSNVVVNGSTFQVTPTYSYRVGFDDTEGDEAFDKFSPNHYYALCPRPSVPNPDYYEPIEVLDPITNEVIGYTDPDGNPVEPEDFPIEFLCGDALHQLTYFTIETKDPSSKTFTISDVPGLNGIPLNGISRGDAVYRWDFARYETTKNASEVWLQFTWNLSARDRDKGTPRTHGIIYDVMIRRVDVPLGSENRLIRCLTRSKNRSKIFTSLHIKNLELGRYYIEIRPVLCSDCDLPLGPPIHEIGEYGIRRDVVTEYDAGRGPVVVESEFAAGSIPGNFNFIPIIGWGDNKVDISSEAGPVGQLTFVDEVVQPDVMGRTKEEINYPGLALLGYLFDVEANDAMSILVDQGIICNNYVATGESLTAATGTTLEDLSADFVGDNILPGWIVKNIRTQQTSQIAPGGVSTNQLILIDPIDWEFCDRYVIYFQASSCYFPDVLCWFFITPDIGVAKYFPFVEWFVDWDSIIEARKWCVDNRYFYDMAISREMSFAAWAEEEARASLLYIGQVGGMVSLRINRVENPSFVFNSSNASDFRLTVSNQQKEKPNQVIGTFRDGSDTFEHDGRARFRPESFLLQTPELTNGLEIEIETRLKLNSVTYQEQAVDVCSYFLKTQREQSRQITFNTSYIGVELRFGDWIRVQLESIEKAEELSGFVVETIVPFDPATGTQTVKLSDVGWVWRGCVTSLTPTTVVLDGDHDINLSVGDIIVDAFDNQLTITDVSNYPEISYSPASQLNEDYIFVYRTSLDDLVGAAMGYDYDETPIVQNNLTFSGVYGGDGYGIIISGLTQELPCLSPVVVGYPEEYETLYRITTTVPKLDGSMEVTAISIKEEFFDKEGLVVLTNDDSTVEEF